MVSSSLRSSHSPAELAFPGACAQRGADALADRIRSESPWPLPDATIIAAVDAIEALLLLADGGRHQARQAAIDEIMIRARLRLRSLGCDDEPAIALAQAALERALPAVH